MVMKPPKRVLSRTLSCRTSLVGRARLAARDVVSADGPVTGGAELSLWSAMPISTGSDVGVDAVRHGAAKIVMADIRTDSAGALAWHA